MLWPFYLNHFCFPLPNRDCFSTSGRRNLCIFNWQRPRAGFSHFFRSNFHTLLPHQPMQSIDSFFYITNHTHFNGLEKWFSASAFRPFPSITIGKWVAQKKLHFHSHHIIWQVRRKKNTRQAHKFREYFLIQKSQRNMDIILPVPCASGSVSWNDFFLLYLFTAQMK